MWKTRLCPKDLNYKATIFLFRLVVVVLHFRAVGGAATIGSHPPSAPPIATVEDEKIQPGCKVDIKKGLPSWVVHRCGTISGGLSCTI
uniref:Uncharacterized protein n=1 Tax=Physcomitrium patens TaxID=3218 RepID=A0A2K1KH90_PHYPA|nr:hypothetical protein PHYPA_009527 [Physcomitrium patens]